MRIIGFTGLVAGSLALAACGGSKQDEQPAGETAAPATSPEAAAPAAAETPAGPSLANAPADFAKCTTCHTIQPGVIAVGPSLFGVFGKKAGSEPGYTYSDGNKNSGLTWDEKTLDTYLTAPMKMVPGTKMTFAGEPDAAKRKAIIEFLKTLK